MLFGKWYHKLTDKIALQRLGYKLADVELIHGISVDFERIKGSTQTNNDIKEMYKTLDKTI